MVEPAASVIMSCRSSGGGLARLASRTRAVTAAAVLLAGGALVSHPVHAENRMGYRLLSQQAAAQLPHNRGSLGMDIARAQQITDDGMTFDIMLIKTVRRGSPGGQAGFRPGDQIVAVDGQVFADLSTFAAYVGSIPPGRAINVDYIPANGGPAQAQRVAVTVGAVGGGAQAPAVASGGLSTGTKVAIGVGAAALFGCYELGCFSHRPEARGGVDTVQRPDAAQPQLGSPAR